MPTKSLRRRPPWRRAPKSAGARRQQRSVPISDEIAAAEARMVHDRCATLDYQLRWLRDAGFAEVDCAFKSWRFAVYSGVRPA